MEPDYTIVYLDSQQFHSIIAIKKSVTVRIEPGSSYLFEVSTKLPFELSLRPTIAHHLQFTGTYLSRSSNIWPHL